MQTILIVEDDPAIARGLKDNLISAGYSVLHAADGETGLAIALDHPVDLILLDLMLPKLNGYEICSAVRREKKEVPILMLTAKGQEEDVVRGLESGADDYVIKPFSVRELMARVKNFLRLYAGAQPEVYEFGDCRLDLGSHCFYRAGVEVELTSKEFRLLAYFLSRPGRALTRDQILNAVWGNQILVTSRSVDRCVTTLRSKIEPNGEEPVFIKTIRDVGYRFELP
jgi:DNA-binding response OmpR family regulator